MQKLLDDSPERAEEKYSPLQAVNRGDEGPGDYRNYLHRGDALDISVDLVAVDTVGNGDLGDTTGELGEGKSLARNVEAEGFAQTTKANVSALAKVEAAGFCEVEHDTLLDRYGVAAEEFPDFLGIKFPDNVESQPGN